MELTNPGSIEDGHDQGVLLLHRRQGNVDEHLPHLIRNDISPQETKNLDSMAALGGTGLVLGTNCLARRHLLLEGDHLLGILEPTVLPVGVQLHHGGQLQAHAVGSDTDSTGQRKDTVRTPDVGELVSSGKLEENRESTELYATLKQGGPLLTVLMLN